MKKTILVAALAFALVLTFAATALAASTVGTSQFWNADNDYYSWTLGGPSNTNVTNAGTLGTGGTGTPLNDNATVGGGVHANYTATTAKCGICHSVHRAKAGGVHLLNTDTATCAGCHIAGTSTVTNVVVAWGTPAAQLAGPHGATSDPTGCYWCHANSPHGVNGSQYGVFNAKMLKSAVDNAVAAAAADPGNSGVTGTLLIGAGQSTNFTGASDAVRVGYTCNTTGCHMNSMLPVINAGWSESRNTTVGTVAKTGHLSVSAVGTTAFTAASSCTGCHDQVDVATRTGFTFPHAQKETGSGSANRLYLWYNIAANNTATKTGMTDQNMKSFDGACLKCHRNGLASEGVGITY
jgi:predicted CXXCH cytochrome family protein